MSFIFLEMLSFYRDSSFEFPVLSGRNFWKNNLVKYLDKYRGVLRAWSNIYNGVLFVEILNFLGSLKIVLWEILQDSQENICVGISLFDKVKLGRSAALLETRL